MDVELLISLYIQYGAYYTRDYYFCSWYYLLSSCYVPNTVTCIGFLLRPCLVEVHNLWAEMDTLRKKKKKRHPNYIECGWCCNLCIQEEYSAWAKAAMWMYMTNLGKCSNSSVARVGPRLQKTEWWKRDKAIRLGFSCENIVILFSIFET